MNKLSLKFCIMVIVLPLCILSCNDKEKDKKEYSKEERNELYDEYIHDEVSEVKFINVNEIYYKGWDGRAYKIPEYNFTRQRMKEWYCYIPKSERPRIIRTRCSTQNYLDAIEIYIAKDQKYAQRFWYYVSDKSKGYGKSARIIKKLGEISGDSMNKYIVTEIDSSEYDSNFIE